MKVVADTNVLVSGLLWTGPSASFLNAAIARTFQLLSSEELLAELEEVLGRPHLEPRLIARGRTVKEVMAKLRALTIVISPADMQPPPELRDPKDLPVLQCAAAGSAQVIVSGDNDLLTLKEFQGILILTPRLFIGTLGL